MIIRYRFLHGDWRIRVRENLKGDYNIAAINSVTGKVARIRISLKFIEDTNHNLGMTMEDVIEQFG